MTLDTKYNAFNASLCSDLAAISVSLDTTININVTTCSSGGNNFLLNEDGVTPILNEDLNEILVE